MPKKAKFGFKEVNYAEKEPLVQAVFSSVAPKYDLMNTLMSFGLHKVWKQTLLQEISPASHETLLDVAGGTGDIASAFLQAGGKEAIVADLNPQMLKAGQTKHTSTDLKWVHANAEELPFAENTFDYYTISFGLRNVSNIDKALREAFRVLKPMGKFFCLEFSQITTPILRSIYQAYSFKIIPQIGRIIANDEAAYRYLVESIKEFDAAPYLSKRLENAGFEEVHYIKLTFGIVAIHIGYKLR